jgi:hypothetical protein
MAIRYGFFVGIIGAVVGLCLMAWRLSAATEALDQLPHAASQAVSAPIGKAEAALATARLQQAWTAANVYLAQNGTLDGFTEETLRRLDPTLDASVVLAWTAPADACFQTGQGAEAVHVQVSTSGPPLAGPC